ncbi:uncharacterized protein SCHCODRAFT_02299786 [Schizophyllum commune H4-8]|nr:uncharacterized protein SCHCODRAFT_02299786 [Schizophyllum commune H4-8]KAI5892727.1 hypothetical protein SCHCODRAFT_02299786 [Schizophyllum commune H4-8]
MWTPMRLGYSDFFLSGVRAITKRPMRGQSQANRGASMESASEPSSSATTAIHECVIEGGDADLGRPEANARAPTRSSALSSMTSPSPPNDHGRPKRRWSMKPTSIAKTPDFAPLEKRTALMEPSVTYIDSLFVADPFSAEKSQSFYADFPTSVPKHRASTKRKAVEHPSFLTLNDSSSDGPLSFPRLLSRSSSTSSTYADSTRSSTGGKARGKPTQCASRASRNAHRASMPPVHLSTCIPPAPPHPRRRWRVSMGPLGAADRSGWA